MMQPRGPKVASERSAAKKKSEDAATIELVRELLEKLNGLGDRLEDFIIQGEQEGGRP